MAKCRICLLAVILVVLSAIRANAQEITVTDFYFDEHDLTANRFPVEDQNGEKCALIRVQTTQKGFVFDVGSAGITKTEDDKPGEIWLWVPYGIKNISIRHEKLGSLPKYGFPIAIKKARVYIMKITHEKVFTTNYDDSKKQKLFIKVTPPTASLSINGMSVPINKNGETTMDMAYGEFAYKVEAARFYPEEGLVTVDDTHKTLIIDNLKPIMGKISVHTNPLNAKVTIAERTIERSSIEPVELQIGEYEVKVSANGYKTETKIVTITENQTTNVQFKLTQAADYRFTSTPSGATIFINGEEIGYAYTYTPLTKTLTTGTYTIKATKSGYKNFEQEMQLNSSNPEVNVSLKKIFNYKNEVYFEGNLRAGGMTAVGGTMGMFIHNVNFEAAYYYGFCKSENIYWCSNDYAPSSVIYSPTMNITAKTGIGIPISTRWRIAPQIGAIYSKLKDVETDGNYYVSDANNLSMLASLRISVALSSRIGISITPEYQLGIKKSDGFAAMSEVSPIIRHWSEGFNTNFGIVLFF